MNTSRNHLTFFAFAAGIAALAALTVGPHAHSAACNESFCIFSSSLKSATRGSVEAAPAETPDLILVNGVVYTGDTARPRVEAVAIKGERIIAVGSTREIRAIAAATTKAIDLNGRFATPGFNDAHIHLANGGQAKLAVDLTRVAHAVGIPAENSSPPRGLQAR